MRELKVTGLAQESDFEKEGVVEYLLVLNKGLLRIPISQEVAQEVIKAMYSPGEERPSSAPVPMSAEEPPDTSEDEPFVMEDDPEAEGAGLVDEDGVGQV